MDLHTIWEITKVTIALVVLIFLVRKSKDYRNYD